MPPDVTSRPYHTRGNGCRRATFSASRHRKGLHRYARRNGNWVLVFSTHASHQGAVSRRPCSPHLRGEREKTGNGPQTQGSAGAPPWATNISPLPGLGQNTQPFWLLAPDFLLQPAVL